MLYASDYQDYRPPINADPYVTGWMTAHTNWWFILIKGYIVGLNNTNSGTVWRCPSVLDADINPGNTAYFGVPWQGNGPAQNNSAQVPNRHYNYPAVPGGVGSKKMSQLSRTLQLWIFGDDGSPKSLWTQDSPVRVGYNTDVTVAAPIGIMGWVNKQHKNNCA